MMNIIRADIYRTTRGKVIYVAYALVMALSIGLILLATLLGDGYVAPILLAEEAQLSGMNSVDLLFPQMLLLIAFTLPMITTVVGPIFTDGTAKNEVSWGMSRIKLYVARLLIVSMLNALIIFFFFGSGMLLSTILNGFGGTPPDGYWVGLLQIIAGQIFMFIAAGCFGVFLVFTMKNIFAVVEVYIGVIALPSVFAGMLMMIGDFDLSWIERILYIDLMASTMRLASMHQMELYRLLLTLGVGALFLVVFTTLGLYMFRRKEIK